MRHSLTLQATQSSPTSPRNSANCADVSYFIKPQTLFIYFFLLLVLTRREGRERNIDWRPLAPAWTKDRTRNPGMSPTRNRTSDLSVCRTAPNPLSPTGRGTNSLIKYIHVIPVSIPKNESKKESGQRGFLGPRGRCDDPGQRKSARC